MPGLCGEEIAGFALPYDPPSHNRSCLGLFIAPTIGILVFVIGLVVIGIENSDDFWLLVVFGALLGAYPATVVIGLPAYFLLRGRVPPTAFISIFVGVLVGAAPALFWNLWFEKELVFLAAIAGAAGGFAFWLVAHREIEADSPEAPS